MKAAPEDQAKLLKLQEIDRSVAGIKHELATLPATARAQELQTEINDLHNQVVQAQSSKKDLLRALKQAEDEIWKVQERAKTQRERLDAGGISPKEMERIQEEISLLTQRQGELEDTALDAMDAVERSTESLNSMERNEEELESQLEDAQAQAQEESGKLKQDLQDTMKRRQDLAGELPPDLVAEYEALRKSSGIGVVEVHGVKSVGVILEFSVADVSRLESAAPDDVIVSEDHEVILVRR